MRNKILGIILGALILGIGLSTFIQNRKADKVVIASSAKSSSYWTCAMHPQIHSEHPGECPICHMKLIQVKAQDEKASETNRSDVHASSNQLGLIGIQKQTVERMDLTVSIPVAGRLISNSSVAFQVYESDLPLVKPGLSFRGQSSFADGEISGSIVSVDSIVDPTSRTVRVLGRIEKGPKGLISEITLSGVIKVLLKNKVSISESSVLHTGQSDLVYVFSEKDKLSPREVKLGPKSEGFYEVVSGLEPGEVISSGPNFLIDSEAKIRGSSESPSDKSKAGTPQCPKGESWDIPMAMCMPSQVDQ